MSIEHDAAQWKYGDPSSIDINKYQKENPYSTPDSLKAAGFDTSKYKYTTGYGYTPNDGTDFTKEYEQGVLRPKGITESSWSVGGGNTYKDMHGNTVDINGGLLSKSKPITVNSQQNSNPAQTTPVTQQTPSTTLTAPTGTNNNQTTGLQGNWTNQYGAPLTEQNFDSLAYIQDKVNHANSIGYKGKTDWDADSVRAEMAADGMTPWQHFNKIGQFENWDWSQLNNKPAEENNPTDAVATLYNVDPTTQTVQGQLNGLLNSDSPYIQLARQQAAEQANSRGLLNSGLAASAGEKAAIEAAFPIAQQDASTYYNQENLNQAAENTYGLQNNKNHWDDYFKQVDFNNDSALQRQKDLSAYDRAKLNEDGANYRAEMTRDLNFDQLSADSQKRMAGYIDSAMSDFQTQYAALMTDPDLANDPSLPKMLDFLTSNTKNKLLSQSTVLGIRDFNVNDLGLPTITDTSGDTSSVVSGLRNEITALPEADRSSFATELLSQMKALPAADKATIENMLGISLSNTDATGLLNAFMGTLNA